MVESTERAPKPINQGELNSRQALAFLDTIVLFDKTPKQFLRRKNIPWQDMTTVQEEGLENKGKVLKRLRRDLYDLHFRSDQPEVDQRLNQTYGVKKFVLFDMLDSAAPKIEEIEEKRLTPSKPYGFVQRMKIAKEVTHKVLLRKNLDPDQKEHFLSLIGYSSKEAKDIRKAIAASSGFAAIGGIIYGLGNISAFVYGLLGHPFSSVTANDPRLALTYSILINQAVTMASAYSDKRLLEKTGKSPNEAATGTFYVMKKLFPDHKRSVAPSIVIATSALALMADAGGVTGFAFFPKLTLPALVARDLANAALHVGEIAIKEGIIFRKNHKAKSKT